MTPSHHALIVLVPRQLVHALNARVVDATHQTIAAGFPVALQWPLIREDQLGDLVRAFGSPDALDALRERLQALMDADLVRMLPVTATPPQCTYVMHRRDRAVEKRATPAAVARRAREKGYDCPDPAAGVKAPATRLPAINMVSNGSERRFTLWIRTESCAPDTPPAGGTHYGLGWAVPVF